MLTTAYKFLLAAAILLTCIAMARYMGLHTNYRDGLFHKIYNRLLYLGLKAHVRLILGEEYLHRKLEFIFGTYEPENSRTEAILRKQQTMSQLQKQMKGNSKGHYGRDVYNLKILDK